VAVMVADAHRVAAAKVVLTTAATAQDTEGTKHPINKIGNLILMKIFGI
jgi:hypothetical protein